MKELYINNIKALIPQDTYFPFTYKISDLEEINIINFPSSKTVSIPRNSQNDYIFGYVAEITRKNMSSLDNLSSISFNQIKKATYELYNDSQLISTGLIVITNITTDNYEVELYDGIIDKLEQLNGNAETGEGYLNNLDIILNDNSTFSLTCNASSIKALNETGTEVVPLFNICDSTSTGTDVVCLDKQIVNNNTTYKYKNLTLPTELTPLQFRTVKPWDIGYGVKLNTLIKSINTEYDNIITTDTFTTNLFNDVHLLTNKPSNKKVKEEYSLNPATLNLLTASVGYSGTPAKPNYNLSPTIVDMPLIDGAEMFGNKNGNYYYNLNYNMIINCDDVNNKYLISTFKNKIYTLNPVNFEQIDNYVYSPLVYANYGEIIGELFVNIGMGLQKNGQSYKSKYIETKIILKYGVNTFISYDNNKLKMNISGTILCQFDFYPELGDITGYVPTLFFDFSNIYKNTLIYANPNKLNPHNFLINITAGEVTRKSLNETKTGDIISGKNILPKVSVQDFIINTCKFFNLGLKIKDNSIYIHKKNYEIDTKGLIVDDITDINIKNLDFNKIIITNGLPDDKNLDDYKTYLKKTYAEQVINTGYSLKNNFKKIELPISVPALFRDVNNYAYDSFADYFNGGYSRNLNGNTKGLTDKLTFGFVKNITETIWVGNDLYFEAGITSPTELIDEEPSDISFKMSSSMLYYDNEEDKFLYFTDKNDNNSTLKLNSYKTISPYYFLNENLITQSLEVNKPVYNFADLTDSIYPDNATLFNMYHKGYIVDKYQSDTHILSAKIFIEGLPNIYKIYNYKNSNYIISELEEYDPSTPDFYSVKLMRVNNIYNYYKDYTSVPIVRINKINNIDYTTINIEGEVINDGDLTITQKGFVYSKINQNPTILDDKSVNSNLPYIFTNDITGLDVNTIYYIRAYAINSKGTTYSETMIFSTKNYYLPETNIINFTTVTETSAVANCQLVSNGGTNITEKGIIYSNSAVDLIIVDEANRNFSSDTGFWTKGSNWSIANGYAKSSGSVGGNLTSQSGILTVGKIYTIKMSVTNFDGPLVISSGGNSYTINQSGIYEFDLIAGSTNLNIFSNINYRTWIDSIIIKEKAKKIIYGSGDGNFSVNITSLTASSNYFVQSYATNSIGTAFSDIKNLSTVGVSLEHITVKFKMGFKGDVTQYSDQLNGYNSDIYLKIDDNPYVFANDIKYSSGSAITLTYDKNTDKSLFEQTVVGNFYPDLYRANFYKFINNKFSYDYIAPDDGGIYRVKSMAVGTTSTEKFISISDTNEFEFAYDMNMPILNQTLNQDLVIGKRDTITRLDIINRYYHINNTIIPNGEFFDYKLNFYLDFDIVDGIPFNLNSKIKFYNIKTNFLGQEYSLNFNENNVTYEYVYDAYRLKYVLRLNAEYILTSQTNFGTTADLLNMRITTMNTNPYDFEISHNGIWTDNVQVVDNQMFFFENAGVITYDEFTGNTIQDITLKILTNEISINNVV